MTDRLLKSLVAGAVLTLAGCASMPPPKPSYVSEKALAAALPHVQYWWMEPVTIGEDKFIATNIDTRLECPTYATIRLSDSRIRSWRICPGQEPVEFHPDLPEWPRNDETEYLVEEEMDLLFNDPRKVGRQKEYKGFVVMTEWGRLGYSKHDCLPMNTFVKVKDSDGKHFKGIAAFYRDTLCKGKS